MNNMKKIVMLLLIALSVSFIGCDSSDDDPKAKIRFQYDTDDGSYLYGVRYGKAEAIPLNYGITDYKSVKEGSYPIELLLNDGSWIDFSEPLKINEDEKITLRFWIEDDALSCEGIPDRSLERGNNREKIILFKKNLGNLKSYIE